jgi:recombination protein RecR|tara:strand:- start:805 stop:1404 length:600 start_codon:yes stop_codon:yes gene_type:complete
MNSSEIDILINEISKLPGLGRRSAQRIAIYLLKNKSAKLSPLIKTLTDAQTNIVDCNKCGNIDMIDPCNLCQNSKRDDNTILVVEDVSDLWTFERTGFYKGKYHVLGGSLSAMNGLGINELRISKLIDRIKVQKIDEVILALSTTMEGQTTSHVIADKLETFKDLTITRLAQGIPMGGEVHFLDENTLNAAFQSRKKII